MKASLATAFLAYCSAISALAIDTSLPAFDAIHATFPHAGIPAGFTLTAFMVGFALSQPVFGAASQRFGRRPVLLFGSALFAACGFGCATAGSLPELLAWRVFQGIGASAVAVLVLAIVRDRYDGERARRLIAEVGAAMMVAPMIAPTVGAALLGAVGWRGIFAMLGSLGAILLVLVLTTFSESIRAREPAALRPSHVFASWRRIYGDPTTGGYAVIAGLSFGGMFAYIAGSSTLFLDELGVGLRTYGVIFAFTSATLLLGNLASNVVARRGVTHRVALAGGLACAIVASLGLLALASAHVLAVWSVLPLLALTTFALGVVAPNAAHGVLDPLPEIAGPASAAIGAGRVACGAIASACVAALAPFGPIGMAATMALFTAASLAVYVVFVRPADAHVRARGRAHTSG